MGDAAQGKGFLMTEFNCEPGAVNYVIGTFMPINTNSIFEPMVQAGECHEDLMMRGGRCTLGPADLIYPDDKAEGQGNE